MEMVELRSTSFAPRQIEQARLRSVWRRLWHQTICIVYTISSTRFPVIIVPYAHTLESINKLVVIFLIFEDILVIYASHHHMATFGAASTVPRSLEHCQVVTKVNKVNIPVLDSFLACLGMLYVYRVNLFWCHWPVPVASLRAIPKLCKSSVPAIFSLSLPWGWGTAGWGGAPLGKGDWGFRKHPIFLLWVRFLQHLLHFAKKLLPRLSQITICHTFVLFPWLRISVDS